VNDLTREEINNPHAVVAELCDEQALACEVDRHVIDPAANLTEWDFGL
jgi:hypothetical protein